MSNGNMPFSIEELVKMCGGNKVVVEAVMDEFLTQVPDDTAVMEQGMSGGELMDASRAAHRLKGTAGTFGAEKLHSLCAQMELLCKEGKGEEAATVYAELKAEALACVDAIPQARTML